MTSIPQTDGARDGAFESETNSKACIERRLRAASPATYEVAELERISGPFEDIDHRSRKPTNRKLGFKLTVQ